MWTPLALALLCIPAEPKIPEIVALPLSTSDDKASQGLEAWKIVADSLAKAKKKLKLGVNLQKKHNDFLVGPVREQARDCGDDLGCMGEIGTALGADLLVAGKIDDAGVSLRVIDVAARSALVDARSPDGLKKADVKKQAQTAAKLLINALVEQQKKKPGKGETPGGAVAGVTGGAPGIGGQDTGMSGGAPVMKNGRIQIGKDQLAGVKKLTIDGELVSFSGDGSAGWSGPPGSHRVVAERSDGQRVTKEVTLDPDRTTNVSLEFAAFAASTPAASATQKNEPEGEGVTSKWWFWTSVGLAVAGGAATAILLASGDKGGPELPDDTGIIRGTY